MIKKILEIQTAEYIWSKQEQARAAGRPQIEWIRCLKEGYIGVRSFSYWKNLDREKPE
jgi:hypothetical protein